MNNAPQVLMASPFFYYNHEPTADHRQHGYFSPHPVHSAPHHPLQRFPAAEMTMPPPRPMPEPLASHAPVFLSSLSMPSVGAPLAMVSPPLYPKSNYWAHDSPSLSLDTERGHADGFGGYPSTPPLSIAGSTISSPPMSCGLLPTPVHRAFFANENMEGVKEGCEGDVKSEILAGGDWTRCGTPPLTPGTLDRGLWTATDGDE